MSRLEIDFPESLHAGLRGQAQAAGVSVDQFIVETLAARLAGEGAAAAYFSARAARAIPGQAEEILSRAGIGNPPLPGDEISS